MPIFHFHLHSRSGVLRDEEGSHHRDDDAAIAAMHEIARAVLASDIASGSADLMQSIVLARADGQVIETISFIDALRFQHPEDQHRILDCAGLRAWRETAGLPTARHAATAPAEGPCVMS